MKKELLEKAMDISNQITSIENAINDIERFSNDEIVINFDLSKGLMSSFGRRNLPEKVWGNVISKIEATLKDEKEKLEIQFEAL